MNLIVHRIVTGPFQENTFLVREKSRPDLLIIDPGDDGSLLIDFIQKNALKPVAILNTHAHLDHIGAVAELKERFQIPFYLPSGEEENLEHYPQSCTLFGIPPGKVPEVDHWIHDKVAPEIASFTIDLMRTPGHTVGSTCFRIGEHVFTGDTLFHLSVGRTDLPGGSWTQLEQSLALLMRTLEDDTIIHSGHGPDTTIAVEKKRNPFLIQMKTEVN